LTFQVFVDPATIDSPDAGVGETNVIVTAVPLRSNILTRTPFLTNHALCTGENTPPLTTYRSVASLTVDDLIPARLDT
jgi:hypothetical protein